MQPFKMLRPSALLLAGALLAAAVLSVLAGRLLIDLAGLTLAWPGYEHMMAHLDHPAARWRWVIGDISEVAFYKHEFASLGLIAGGLLAWWGGRQGARWQGFPISYGSGLWPWLLLSSTGGLLLGNLLWGWTLAGGAWQPTFVAFVSLPAALVLLHGRGWRVALSGAVMGALLVTPASLLLVAYVCTPWQLPVVVGNVGGMALASLLAFELCRRFPVVVKAPTTTAREQQAVPPIAARLNLRWGLRRVLADFSEAPFYGNEWASLGLIGGALLAYGLNPGSPFYGSGWLPQLLIGQALASAVGVWVWRGQWEKRGWYPTYIPLVSIVPAAVLVHGPAPAVIALSALLGALLTPPLAVAISTRLPAHVHPYIGNVTAMAVGVLALVPLVGWLVTA
ncbi:MULTISPECIES: hypothetical protein [Pseudomonas]|uniref:Integral membrane protein n=1 Tax=Pseudomonas quercus TaxID=2722792 RepID=A0ABX0YAR2_9PSED|nr:MULTISPECIES: hypothetical protein [Pseudomonas]MBF7141478.1 hypothetical protein [Pseudomonas sp. LY10J]NJP00017.1 hypothetical protein [Pseudomonas quercus]